MDPEAFAAAGLYDAGDPAAAERLDLLQFLAEQGCSLDDMLAAAARGRLFALAGDRIIRPDRDCFSLADVATQTGRGLADIRAVWRALGLVATDDDALVASPSDVESVRIVLEVGDAIGLGEALGITRVMAASMARLGDAISTAVRSRVTELSVALSGSEAATARAFATMAELIPGVSHVLDTAFRHHLESARMHFERTDSWDTVTSREVRLAVGFGDLSGFTSLTEHLPVDELSRLLTGFETVAEDVVRSHGARVVKFIGDAVMYVASDAATAVRVGCELLDAARVRGLAARVGVTRGRVLALEGDYFGPVVNLAARLVGLAEPGELLVTAAALDGLPDDTPVSALGPREVRGFTEPVELYRVTSAGSA